MPNHTLPFLSSVAVKKKITPLPNEPPSWSVKVEKIRENNKPSLDGERYYTDKELAVRLKVSRRSLQDYRNNGILPYIQVGGRILYRASDIERTLMDGYKEAYRLKGNM